MTYLFFDCALDESGRTLHRAGRTVAVEPKVFDLLVFLLRHRDRVVRREELLAALWPGQVVSDAALSKCIDRARRAIADTHRAERWIQTIHGRGFRWAAPVVLGPASEPPRAPLPLPPQLAIPPAARLFGRSREEAVLATGWESVKAGERTVVALAGEPGAGKTWLAAHAARAAHADGAAVLFGSCDEQAGISYRPFAQALRHYVVHASDRSLAEHVRLHGPELMRLIPELARRVPEAGPLPSPEAARDLLFEAVAGLLATAAREQPVVLLLEDLHWAQIPEILLFKRIVEGVEPIRLLIIATYRDTDLSRTHALRSLLADLSRRSTVEHLHLQGLDEEAVRTWMTGFAGRELDAAELELASTTCRRSAGNPLFIAELLRYFAKIGWLGGDRRHRTCNGAGGKLGIPDGIRAAIGRRLASLSETTQTVLRLASVIGHQFDLALLMRLVAVVPRLPRGERAEGRSAVRQAPATESTILDALDEATAAAFLSEVPDRTDQYCFRHELIRTTLYEGLSAARRARLHLKVGEMLEDLTGGACVRRIEELAHHWLAAVPVAPPTKAIGYARQAAERAVTALAFEEAAAHLERALGLLEEDDPASQPLRCEVLLALADAERRCGNSRYRETVLRAAAVARALGDPERLGRAALASVPPGGFVANVSALGSGSLGVAIDERLLALFREATSALAEHDGLLPVRVRAQFAVEQTRAGHAEECDSLSASALGAARRIGDRSALAHALSARIFAIDHPATLAERARLTEELEEITADLGNAEVTFAAAYHRAGTLLESGDAPGAQRQLERLDRIAADLRQPFLFWWSRMGRAMWAILQGAPEAEGEVLAAMQAGSRGSLRASPGLNAQVVRLRRDQGRLDELAGLLEATLEARPASTALRTVLALTCCETDRLQEAREHLNHLRETGLDFPRNHAWAMTICLLSEVCRDVNDREAAAVLYPQIAPLAGQVGVALSILACYGSLAHPAGQLAATLGDWEAAEGHFADALRANERLGARPLVVRTRRAHAALLLDRGLREESRRALDLIASALAEAERLGMAREVVRLKRLLPERGASRRRIRGPSLTQPGA